MIIIIIQCSRPARAAGPAVSLRTRSPDFKGLDSRAFSIPRVGELLGPWGIPQRYLSGSAECFVTDTGIIIISSNTISVNVVVVGTVPPMMIIISTMAVPTLVAMTMNISWPWP